MKARVKATGDIIEVERIGIASDIWALQSDSTVVFDDEELDINIEPDYWEKLKHQYAGMAMQQMVNIVNVGYEYVYEETAIIALNFATALVNRLKEEEK